MKAEFNSTSSPLASLNRKMPSIPKGDEALKKAANEFEALFVDQMLQQMRQSGIKSELFPEKEGEQTFRAMLDSEYSKMASQHGSFGIAKALYQQLKKTSVQDS